MQQSLIVVLAKLYLVKSGLTANWIYYQRMKSLISSYLNPFKYGLLIKTVDHLKYKIV